MSKFIQTHFFPYLTNSFLSCSHQPKQQVFPLLTFLLRWFISFYFFACYVGLTYNVNGRCRSVWLMVLRFLCFCVCVCVCVCFFFFSIWLDSYGVFVWRWNRVDEKLLKENGKENFFGVCLVGWGGRKIDNRTQVFSLWAHQKVFFPKWREN